jgi:hypothetical protein
VHTAGVHSVRDPGGEVASHLRRAKCEGLEREAHQLLQLLHRRGAVADTAVRRPSVLPRHAVLAVCVEQDAVQRRGGGEARCVDSLCLG